MITRKFLLGLGLCSVLAFPVTNALADCANVEVIQAGSANAGKVVKLRNTSGAACGSWAINGERFFILDNITGQASGMLAAALSAQASGNKVVVVPKAGGTFGEWSSMQAVYSVVAP